MIKNIIKNMSLLEWLILTTITLLLFALFYVGIYESRQWQKFITEHNCEIVSHVAGSSKLGIGTGIMTNGQFGTGTIIVTESSKTGYLCDDGITYWR